MKWTKCCNSGPFGLIFFGGNATTNEYSTIGHQKDLVKHFLEGIQTVSMRILSHHFIEM